MDYQSLLDAVQWRTALNREQADAVAKATVQGLADQVSTWEMLDAMAQLPDQLSAITPAAPDRQRHLPFDEFSLRVAERAGLGGPDRSRAYVHSVFTVLGQAVDAEVLRAAIAQLRPEYQTLLPTETDAAGEFLARVRRRGGLHTQQAAVTSTHAVLAALAERLSEGQANGLAATLPAELRPYLTSSKGEAQPFHKAGFLGGVGAEAGLDDDDTAEAHARAVLATVREAAPEKEIGDTLAQLPPDLADMFT